MTAVLPASSVIARAAKPAPVSSRHNEAKTDVCATATLAPPPALKLGDLVSKRYLIKRLLGRGGGGTVYQAFDLVGQKALALKAVHHASLDRTAGGRHSSRELDLLRQVRHRNVCKIFDVVSTLGRSFVVMELGRACLADELNGGSGGDVWDRVFDAMGIVEGVAALHDAGLVHRDIKPGNILRMDTGQLAISDFGLMVPVSANRAPLLGGTPAYMAPECRAGVAPSFAGDVWALGIVLYQVMFRTKPETGEAAQRRSTLAGTRSPQRAFERLSAQCLQFEPEKRPRNAREVARLLKAALRAPAATTGDDLPASRAS